MKGQKDVTLSTIQTDKNDFKKKYMLSLQQLNILNNVILSWDKRKF